MIGKEFETGVRLPVAALFFLLVAILHAVTAGVLGESDWLVSGILPALLAAFLWRASRNQIRFRLGESGIEILPQQLVLAYDQIVAVRRVQRNGRSDLLAIATDRWLLELPESPSLPIAEIESFVRSRTPLSTTGQPPVEMLDYYRHQVELFGEDKVVVIPARQQFSSYPLPAPRFRRNAIALAFILSGIAWIIYGAVRGEQKVVFAGSGAMLIVFTLLFWALFRVRPWASPRKVAPKLRNACLILSPQGLAMMQADLNGTLPWEEVLGLVETAEARSFRISSLQNSLLIKLHGAELALLDIYQESPKEIATRIRANLGSG